MLKGKCIPFLSKQHIKQLSMCSFLTHPPWRAILQHVLESVSCRRERNILADLQTGHMGSSVLGGELPSTVSSLAVNDVYRSHSDLPRQGGRHGRRGRVTQRPIVERGDCWLGKPGTMEVESSSLGCHAKQKASEKSASH